MMNQTVDEHLKKYGFVEISIDEGMTKAQAYTRECSGGRSDCCTRTCSPKCGTAGDWEQFLKIEGGQVQY